MQTSRHISQQNSLWSFHTLYHIQSSSIIPIHVSWAKVLVEVQLLGWFMQIYWCRAQWSGLWAMPDLLLVGSASGHICNTQSEWCLSCVVSLSHFDINSSVVLHYATYHNDQYLHLDLYLTIIIAWSSSFIYICNFIMVMGISCLWTSDLSMVWNHDASIIWAYCYLVANTKHPIWS